MAARFRIIALTKALDAGRTSWTLAFWYNVAASRQKFFVRPSTYVSAWVDATAADNTALQNGQVFEELVQYQPDGSQGTAAIETGAAALWTIREAAFQASNPWANYGTTFDGTTWVVATVA